MNDRMKIAAMAMQGMLASPLWSETPMPFVAECAVDYADALIAALAETNKKVEANGD